MAGLNFGKAIDTADVLVPTGYRSPESGQDEVRSYFLSTASSTYQTAYTVTTGKTFYLTDAIFHNLSGANPLSAHLGISGSPIMGIGIPIKDTVHIRLSVPMKFTTGTVIQFEGTNGSTGVALIGFEEQ